MKLTIKTIAATIATILVLQLTVQVQNANAQQVATIPYNWKSVQMVGGGFVPGIIFHPKAKGVRYCRTDMGGAYRWNDTSKRWEPLLDWLSYEDVNLMGVESIALDPNDPNRLYMACGTYTSAKNTAILRSNDRGKTFQRTNVPFTMGGNENGRGNGERMAVDPNNGKILYFGSRQAGLWKSTDQAVTWNKVENFPDVTEAAPAASQDQQAQRAARMNRGSGIVTVVFDPKSKTKEGSSSIYVAVSLMGRDNFYHSADGGKTWQAIAGQPTKYRPTHAILASDGNLYISYGTNPGPNRMTDGGVWKLNTKTGEWTDITPDKPTTEKTFGYAAVAVDSKNPKVVIASSFGRPNGEQIFRSLDSGKTWKPTIGGKETYDYSLAPYISHTGIHWLFDIEIDPFNSNHVLFTTGYGGHETFNFTDADKDKPVIWSAMASGIEETVALELLSPPKGAHLLTAIGDYCGFTHWDLDKPEPSGCYDNPHFGNTNGLACAENKPEMIVRVGIATRNQNAATNIGYSLDEGKTWQSTASMPAPESKLGDISVSSDGSTWVWTPDRSAVYFTTDLGKTWTASKGIPEKTRVIADRVNPKKFYAIALFDGKLFTSNDGGANFAEEPLNLPDGLPKPGNRGDNRGGQDRIYAAPGHERDLWVAAFNGLYHSVNQVSSFVKLDGVQEIHAFGFGKAAPGADYSALYLIGVVNDVRGIYRSTDTAKTWVRINDDQRQWGLVLHITGDPKEYGRVYVGTHGRGTVYGDPATIEK
jgi:photosystem II stability/assembly factor-like uncharacterized protein